MLIESISDVQKLPTPRYFYNDNNGQLIYKFENLQNENFYPMDQILPSSNLQPIQTPCIDPIRHELTPKIENCTNQVYNNKLIAENNQKFTNNPNNDQMPKILTTK